MLVIGFCRVQSRYFVGNSEPGFSTATAFWESVTRPSQMLNHPITICHSDITVSTAREVADIVAAGKTLLFQLWEICLKLKTRTMGT